MLWLVAVAIVLGSTGAASSGYACDEEEFAKGLRRLSDPVLRSNESIRIVGDYRMSARLVHAALHSSKRNNTKLAPDLVRAAGELRLFDCARLLAENVDMEAVAAFEDGPLSSYPAAESLVEFGSRGYDGVFQHIEHVASERQLKIFACVFIQIDGKQLAEFRLEHRLREHMMGKAFPGVDDDLAKNLRRLCEIIRTVDFSKSENWP